MRKTIVYILTILFFASCSESEYNAMRTPSLNRRYLYVSSYTLDFTSSASKKTLNIEADATPWKITIPTSWLSVNKATGNNSDVVDFGVEMNNSADTSRVCVADISSDVSDWTRSFPITITQGKASPYIELENSSLTIDSKEQSLNVSIRCNTEFLISNNAEEWLHVSSININEIKFKIDENNTDNERSAYLSIKAKSYPSVSSTLIIRQKKASIVSSLETLQFAHNASTQSVTIESGASWIATSSAWITVAPSSGKAGNTTINVKTSKNASTNEREGSVYFTITDNNSIELPVKQEGVRLSIQENSLSFDSYSSSKTLDITSNADWSISEKPEWVAISTVSGSGNAALSLTVSDNSSTSVRQGKIIISTTDNVVTKQIDIIQAAKHVDYADASLTYGYSASTQSVSLTTDASWTVENDQNWISVDKYSGSGSASLNISVEENNSTETRMGVIILHIADCTYTISITQDCKVIEINSPAFTFDAAIGSSILSISSNAQWNACVTKGTDWLEISQKNGSNSADIFITVKENNTVSARTGEIVVEIPKGRSYIVNVTQNRKYIRTDMSSVDFGADGGQISLAISTDGILKISKIGTWFGYINKGNIITIIASENTTKCQRTGTIILTLQNLEGGSCSTIIPVVQASRIIDDK